MSEIRAAAQQLRGAQAVAQGGERQQEAREVREKQAEERAERNAEGKEETRARNEGLAVRQLEAREDADRDIETRRMRRAEDRVESDGSVGGRKLGGQAGRLNAVPQEQRADRLRSVPEVEQTDGETNTSPQTQRQEGRGEIIDTLA